MKTIPELSYENIRRMADMTWFTHAQIFDDLLIVAQRETCCYVWKTTAGLVVIDGIWPDERAYQAIMNAIEDAKWGSEKLIAFVMTHGHIDHVGCGKWLTDYHQVRTFLSKQDDALRLATPHEASRSDSWKEFTISDYIADGDVLIFGKQQLKVIATPGHTDGCMSLIFPVTECGKTHTACLFGGATAPWNDSAGKAIQLQSVEKFKKAAAQYHADVALTNHIAFDNGLERIAYSRKRMTYLPNIYILGEDGAQDFLEVFRKVAE